MSYFFIHLFQKFLLCFLHVYLLLFHKSLFLFCLLKLYQRFYYQVTDIRSVLCKKLSFYHVIFITIFTWDSTIYPTGIIDIVVKLTLFWRRFKREFTFLSCHSNLLINLAHRLSHLYWWKFVTVFSLYYALLTKLLTTTACALVKTLLLGFWLIFYVHLSNRLFLLHFFKQTIIHKL